MKIYISSLLFLLGISSAQAQPAAPDLLQGPLTAYQANIGDPVVRKEALRSTVGHLVLNEILTRKVVRERAGVLDRQRMDRQIGAPAAAGNGTSLVSSPSATDIFSAASESGIVDRTTEGSVNTIRLNALGALRLFGGKPKGCDVLLPYCPTPYANPLRGLSVAASFDSSRKDQTGAPAPADATGTSSLFIRAQRTLSAIDVRYELYNRRDVRDSGFIPDWRAAIDKLRVSGADAIDALVAAEQKFDFAKPSAESMLLDRIDATLSQLSPAMRESVLRQQVHDYVSSQTIKDEDLVGLADAWQAFQKVRSDEIAKALFTKAFTFEYTHLRPVDQSAYGHVTLIGSFPFNRQQIEDNGKLVFVPLSSITFNAGVDFYYGHPVGITRSSIRDFQISAQYDQRLQAWKFLNRPQLSVAGYYQYLSDDLVLQFNSDALVPGTDIPLPKPANQILKDTRGSVGIGQIKLIISLGNSGVSIPIAMTVSNRTELLLVKGTEVSGQFGFAFNLDSILSALQSKSAKQ